MKFNRLNLALCCWILASGCSDKISGNDTYPLLFRSFLEQSYGKGKLEQASNFDKAIRLSNIREGVFGIEVRISVSYNTTHELDDSILVFIFKRQDSLSSGFVRKVVPSSHNDSIFLDVYSVRDEILPTGGWDLFWKNIVAWPLSQGVDAEAQVPVFTHPQSSMYVEIADGSTYKNFLYDHPEIYKNASNRAEPLAHYLKYISDETGVPVRTTPLKNY